MPKARVEGGVLGLLFPRRAMLWLGPILAAGAAVVLLGAIVVSAGLIDLSAARPHPQGWARLLHFAFERSTAFHANATPPSDLDSPLHVAAGAAYYGQVCARCHGGPGLGQNPTMLSMRPRPQYLVRDLPIAKFTAPELFRIVKAGVKYSAMPSWPADGRDDEIWHVVAFLRALPAMSPETFRQLAIVAPGDARTSFGPPTRPRRYALRNDDEPPIGDFGYATPVIGIAGYAQTGDVLATCARCHGADGAGGGVFPNLTLQRRDYIAATLAAYASGKRRSGYMQTVATELSPGQIATLADHYAALPRRASGPARPGPAAGERLALVGDPAAGLAPCASCHGVTRAAARAYPLLEGQSAWYIANQMRVFRAGGRGGVRGIVADDPMVAIARKLDGRQIDAVAAYYGNQAPAAVQSFAAIEPHR